MAGGLGVVEIALGVGLQIHGEFVEMLGDLVIVVEVLIKVGLTVSVEVAQADDLIAAADVDRLVDHLEAQRWNSPAAIRRQVSLFSGRSTPSTSQTSPSQVQTAARRPSLQEVEPREPHWQSQGLF